MTRPPETTPTDWEQQLQQDRAALLLQPAFCRVANDLLARAGIWRLTYAGESTHLSAFNEGQRNQGLRLLADLEAAEPTALARLRAHARPDPTPPVVGEDA